MAEHAATFPNGTSQDGLLLFRIQSRDRIRIVVGNKASIETWLLHLGRLSTFFHDPGELCPSEPPLVDASSLWAPFYVSLADQQSPEFGIVGFDDNFEVFVSDQCSIDFEANFMSHDSLLCLKTAVQLSWIGNGVRSHVG